MSTRTALRNPPRWIILVAFLLHMLFWKRHVFGTQDEWYLWLWLLIPVYPMWVEWRPADEESDQVDRGGLARPAGAGDGDPG